MDTVINTNIDCFPLIGKGKVRDIYDLGDSLMIITTDRVSAFDYILPNAIPNKGYYLNKMSEFWFNKTKDIIDNHMISTDIADIPLLDTKYNSILRDRSMLVKKAVPFQVECVVRGYITGSGLKEYQKSGAVCGINLPKGLKESDKLAEPIFTPSSKAAVGDHDENITYQQMVDFLGSEISAKLRDISLSLYKLASDYAYKKGIIIADTKFEFGLYDDKIILIDEVLTPDSSRFWRNSLYTPGKVQDSMDKQVIRNYLESTGWDKLPPVPKLPEDVVKRTSEVYSEIYKILTINN